MSEVRIDSIANESNTGGPVLSGITEFSGQQYFIPPSGTTAERPSDCPPGSIRFNTDSAHLEYWNGLTWLEFEASSNELGGPLNGAATDGVSTSGTGTRAIFGAGYTASGAVDDMDYVTISTLGNSQDFGNLGTAVFATSGYAGNVFGFFSGYANFGTNIYKHTISSTGSSADSGFDITQNRGGYVMGLSNSTRGIVAGGLSPSGPNGTNIIDYHTIPIGGNSQDFGDLTNSKYATATCASSVRGIIAGGSASPVFYSEIEYVTISTLGDAQDFGDLTTARGQFGCCFSNSTRGVIGGGITAPAPSTPINTTEFITITSTGNSQDFGDLSRTNNRDAAAACSPTRGVFAGGDPHTAPYAKVNNIDFLTIQTTGNSQDFGDLTGTKRNHFSGCSNGHGGL
jgi:hypothetical protein